MTKKFIYVDLTWSDGRKERLYFVGWLNVILWIWNDLPDLEKEGATMIDIVQSE